MGIIRLQMNRRDMYENVESCIRTLSYIIEYDKDCKNKVNTINDKLIKIKYDIIVSTATEIKKCLLKHYIELCYDRDSSIFCTDKVYNLFDEYRKLKELIYNTV